MVKITFFDGDGDPSGGHMFRGLRLFPIVAMIAASAAILAPSASASPAIECGTLASETIAKTYVSPRSTWTLRCGTTRYGYRHISSRWTSDPNFDDKIRVTLSYGSFKREGNAVTYQCTRVLVNCKGYIFRVVHENSPFADGRAQGIITAYNN
ncbi:hypothetical protein GCM10010210_14920 [Pseudonocardia hydrocarbonoxydans]|uniref:Uncharacterized protein n=1 Tax=Pseudonocardia hydrocarbonoxydans TaxID=76726 RepID=A0A4Y3WN26_9PSEU|nr:hypothetical protein PHY01_24670 [Pseudonocardia hydrocarbonoxydans]